MTSSPTDLPAPGQAHGQAQPVPPRLRRRWHWFPPLLLVCLIALAVILIARPRSDEEVIFSTFAVHPARNLINIEISGEDKTGRFYRLKAEQAGIAGRAGAITLHRIAVELAPARQADRPDYLLDYLFARADSGTYHPAEKKLTLARAAEIFSSRGHEFHAGEAEIDFASQTLNIPGPVQAWGPQFSLAAGALAAIRDSEKLVFSGGVKLVLHLPPADEVKNQ